MINSKWGGDISNFVINVLPTAEDTFESELVKRTETCAGSISVNSFGRQ